MSGTPPLLRQGDVVAKKYEVEAQLGAGPVGASYSARVINGNRRVVVKLFNGPPAEAALRESVLGMVRRADSDGLVKVSDQGEHLGHLFVVYEYAEGESLRRLMDTYAGQKRSFTLQEACQIVAKVLDALEAAHRAGLVHRHVKPSNIVVSTKSVGPGQGRAVHTPRITGLGFADLTHPVVLQEMITTGDRMHSRYLAPELTSPGQGGSPHADIYSAGVLFYELLVGQTPHGTYLSPTQIRDDLPKHVDDIVDIALAANAEDRYPTVRDMVNDIQRCFQEEEKVASGISKRAMVAIIGGLAAVLGVVGLFLVLSDPEASKREEDEALRARLVRENPTPDGAAIAAKLAEHPDMVWIAKGSFASGRMHSDPGASPTEPEAQVVAVPAFFMDRFEWPNEKGANPDVRVTYQGAEAQCAAAGKRLCTAVEWERACKGSDMRIYAYGNSYNPATCGGDIPLDANSDQKSDVTSGTNADCNSTFGAFDLSGGPKEWTSSTGKGNKRIIKGGKFGNPQSGTRCAFTDEQRPDLTDALTSFRCCRDDPAGQ